MQRPDGSFGETLVEGKVHGGMDPRYGYCAAGIRYILRGRFTGSVQVDGVTIDDINVDGFVRCVQLAEVNYIQSYELNHSADHPAVI